MQDVDGQVDLMRLQSSGHRLAAAQGSPRLEESRQLSAKGQEESHRRVDRHHGGAEPHNLPAEREISVRTREEAQPSVGPMGEKKKVCPTWPSILGNDALIDT